MSDLFNGWPEDGEPVTTMSDEEMVEWCNKTQDTIIAQRKEIERLLAALNSIANNTCCEGCQEAKRVALAALEGDDE